jgi:hemerythrin-like metal-binding protein
MPKKNPWNNSLHIGVRAMDEDHKKIILLCHETLQLSEKQPLDENIIYRIRELIDCLVLHFRREEALFLSIPYPSYENHIGLHRTFIQDAQKRFQQVRLNIDSAGTYLKWMQDTFSQHIYEEDIRYSPYVEGHQAAIDNALGRIGPLEIQSGCQLFIVDDDEQQANMMKAMASASGLNANVYTSSSDFLKASIGFFDIVVLDLQMPVIDGIEIMRDLANRNIRPLFILVSGFDERVLHSAKQLAESKDLTVISTLSKPIRTKEFIQLLQETYQRCRTHYLEQLIIEPVDPYVITDQPEAQDEAQSRVEEFKLALRKHQLILYFQPKLQIDNLKLAGLEIQPVWPHPTQGLIRSEELVQMAEEHQLTNLLTEEVLRLAIQQFKLLDANALHPVLSINLLAPNITDLAMPEKLTAWVNENQINPADLILEISELALMNDTSASLDILNRLRMKGFSLSLDEFGTGYSSLIKLYQAPFAELKIDRQFINNLPHDADAIAIVRICLLLAKELKMKTVAVGVENEDILTQLQSLGCDYGQGSHLAPSMSIDDLIPWLQGFMSK